MKTELIFTRKYNGEEYKFFAHTPSYPDEKGILNMTIEPYVTVETPENSFGYPDLVKLYNVQKFDEKGYFKGYEKRASTTERYLPKWILNKLEKQMITLEEKIKKEVVK